MWLRDVFDRLIRRPVANDPELAEARDELDYIKRRREAIVAERVRAQAQDGQSRARQHLGGR